MNIESHGHGLASESANGYPSEDQLDRLIKLQERTAIAVERLADALVGKPKRRRGPATGSSSRTVMSRSWLRITLKIDGPQSWATITEKAKAAGFSEMTLRTVRHDVATKEYTNGHRVIWRLKED